jgi:hypothetical protein
MWPNSAEAPIGAEKEFAVEREAAADASANRKEDQVAFRAPVPVDQLTQRCQSHIIEQVDRTANDRLQSAARRHAAPLGGQIGQEEHVATLDVRQAWHTHPQCGGTLTDFTRQVVDQPGNPFQDRLRPAVCMGRSCLLRNDLPLRGCQRTGDLGSAEVNTRKEFSHQDHPVFVTAQPETRFFSVKTVLTQSKTWFLL